MHRIELFISVIFLLSCSKTEIGHSDRPRVHESNDKAKTNEIKQSIRTSWETRIPYVVMSAEHLSYEASNCWTPTDEDIINNEKYILDHCCPG